MYAFVQGITWQHPTQVNNSHTKQDHTIYISSKAYRTLTTVVILWMKCNVMLGKNNIYYLKCKRA